MENFRTFEKLPRKWKTSALLKNYRGYVKILLLWYIAAVLECRDLVKNQAAAGKIAKSCIASPFCFGLARSTVADSVLSLLVMMKEILDPCVMAE
jgi:hypothetical protein